MASFTYEDSDPERFQQLCQALLLPDYPDLQCFPIGQRDGGRDGSAPRSGSTPRTILQVKFKRRDEPSEDIYRWLTTTLVKEVAKVERLAQEGAEHVTTQLVLLA